GLASRGSVGSCLWSTSRSFDVVRGTYRSTVRRAATVVGPARPRAAVSCSTSGAAPGPALPAREVQRMRQRVAVAVVRRADRLLVQERQQLDPPVGDHLPGEQRDLDAIRDRATERWIALAQQPDPALREGRDPLGEGVGVLDRDRAARTEGLLGDGAELRAGERHLDV